MDQMKVFFSIADDDIAMAKIAKAKYPENAALGMVLAKCKEYNVRLAKQNLARFVSCLVSITNGSMSRESAMNWLWVNVMI